MTWTHFEFASGSNPYIAMTEGAKKKILRRLRRLGWRYTEIKRGFYVVYDN